MFHFEMHTRAHKNNTTGPSYVHGYEGNACAEIHIGSWFFPGSKNYVEKRYLSELSKGIHARMLPDGLVAMQAVMCL